jgi:hypothetical protein
MELKAILSLKRVLLMPQRLTSLPATSKGMERFWFRGWGEFAQPLFLNY